MTDTLAKATFASLNLPAYLQKALDDVGYEVPSDIQTKTIPPLLEGCDVIGQAQTVQGRRRRLLCLFWLRSIAVKSKRNA